MSLMNLSSLLEWQVESFRLSLFAPDISESATDIWQLIAGQPPDRSESRIREQITQAIGPFKKGNLVVVTQPTRLDCLYLTPEPNNATIGLVETEIDDFRTLAHALLMRPYKGIARIAFGVILVLRVNDYADAHDKLLLSLKSVTLSPESLEDFLYRVNRPHKSEIMQNTKINCLSQWSVQRVESGPISMDESQSKLIMRPNSVIYNCKLELDINNAPDTNSQQILASTDLKNLFEEFVDIGIRIAKQGELL